MSIVWARLLQVSFFVKFYVHPILSFHTFYHISLEWSIRASLVFLYESPFGSKDGSYPDGDMSFSPVFERICSDIIFYKKNLLSW